MRTSGQLQYDVTQWRVCGAPVNETEDDVCEFDGEVDVTYDPEIRTAFWTCPDCGADHEEDLE